MYTNNSSKNCSPKSGKSLIQWEFTFLTLWRWDNYTSDFTCTEDGGCAVTNPTAPSLSTVEGDKLRQVYNKPELHNVVCCPRRKTGGASSSDSGLTSSDSGETNSESTSYDNGAIAYSMGSVQVHCEKPVAVDSWDWYDKDGTLKQYRVTEYECKATLTFSIMKQGGGAKTITRTCYRYIQCKCLNETRVPETSSGSNSDSWSGSSSESSCS